MQTRYLLRPLQLSTRGLPSIPLVSTRVGSSSRVISPFSVHSRAYSDANPPNRPPQPIQHSPEYPFQHQPSHLNVRGYRAHAGIVPLRAPWPWHESTTSTADTQILQRTLFARPSDLNPALLSFAMAVWALYIATWLLLPDARKREPTEEERKVIEANNQRAKEAGILAKLGLGFSNAIFNTAQPLVYFGVSAILASFILGASRIATRVSMVQIRPRDPTKGQGNIVLRLTHVGHEMLPGGKGRARDIKLENCRLYIPNLNDPTTIRLKVINSDGPVSRLLDRLPYSLDMKEVKDADKSNKDVVQSINRLEHVFGPVVKSI